MPFESIFFALVDITEEEINDLDGIADPPPSVAAAVVKLVRNASALALKPFTIRNRLVTPRGSNITAAPEKSTRKMLVNGALTLTTFLAHQVCDFIYEKRKLAHNQDWHCFWWNSLHYARGGKTQLGRCHPLFISLSSE
jgi:hypothetical protein